MSQAVMYCPACRRTSLEGHAPGCVAALSRPTALGGPTPGSLASPAPLPQAALPPGLGALRPGASGVSYERLIEALSNVGLALRDCGFPEVGGERGTTSYDGSQWSGVADLVRAPSPLGGGSRAGIPANLLDCRRAGTTPLGGMASVHVDVEDVPQVHEVDPNQRLMLDVVWQSGRGGGQAQLDITRGQCFTIGAADTITATTRIVPATDAAFVGGNHKRVEATVCWGGGISPKPALATSEGQVLAGPATTTRIAIPRQAQAVMVVTTDPANAGTMTLEFFRDIALGARAFATVNPVSAGTPIVSGAEAIAITVTAAATVIPVWELWL